MFILQKKYQMNNFYGKRTVKQTFLYTNVTSAIQLNPFKCTPIVSTISGNFKNLPICQNCSPYNVLRRFFYEKKREIVLLLEVFLLLSLAL